MLRARLSVSLRSAVLAAAALVASESIVLAQAEPPSGGQGQGQGGGGRGGNRAGGGGRGGFGGGMGRGMMGGMGGMGRGMQDIREALEADFQRRDIPLFVRQLNLTEDQSTVLETIFVDYEGQYQPEVESITASMAEIGRSMGQAFMAPERQQAMRDTWESIQKEMQDAEAANGPMDEETRRTFFRERMQKAAQKFAADAQNSGLDAEIKAAMGQMLEKMESFISRKEVLRTGFVDGMKAVLDDDQLSQWPAFERFLVREKTLPRGRVSGENVNLFFVVDELRLPQDQFAKIEPFFNDYEGRLHTALTARNDYLAQSMPQLFKSVQSGDVDGAGRIFRRQAELRSSVRDVNEEFRAAMIGALGETEWAQQLDKAVLTAGWDRIYRPTSTDRLFEEAMKIEGLDAAVVGAIAELYGSYRQEITPFNARLKDIARTSEPDQIVRDGERFVSAMSQGISGMAANMANGFPGSNQTEDPMRRTMDERSKIGETYEERLKALLTPEQWEALPKGRGRGGDRGDAGGGPGGQGGMERMLERLPEEQRKQFMDRVDTNKNGTIDEEERQGVREYMREQFQNMRGGNGGAGDGGGRRDRGGNGGGAGGGNDA